MHMTLSEARYIVIHPDAYPTRIADAAAWTVIRNWDRASDAILWAARGYLEQRFPFGVAED